MFFLLALVVSIGGAAGLAYALARTIPLRMHGRIAIAVPAFLLLVLISLISGCLGWFAVWKVTPLYLSTNPGVALW